MRDMAKVYSSFWTSPSIGRLSEDGRMLAIYLLTSQHGNSLGAFRLPEGYVSEDLKWTPERVRQGFDELLRERFANRCERVNWVWVFGYLKWNKPDNPNQLKSLVKLAAKIPEDCAWKPAFIKVHRDLFAGAKGGRKGGAETVVKPFVNGSETVPYAGAHADLSLKDKDRDQDQDQRSSAQHNVGPVGNILPQGTNQNSQGQAHIGHQSKAKAKAKTLSVEDLVACGVQRQHAEDWFIARKGKRAPQLTVTAWEAVKLEAAKAGVSLDEAVAISAANSWQGFKAEWYKPTGLQRHGQQRVVPAPGSGGYGPGGDI